MEAKPDREDATCADYRTDTNRCGTMDHAEFDSHVMGSLNLDARCMFPASTVAHLAPGVDRTEF